VSRRTRRAGPPLVAPGDRFGRLRVLSVSGPTAHAKVACVCDCGRQTTPRVDALLRGRARSCGCLMREETSKRFTRHGHARGNTTTPEYQSWASLIERCGNPKRPHWKHYGGRGITVCDRWRSFEAFLADMGPRPSTQHSLDRINNDGPYAPGNVRWATRTEQMRNTRGAKRLTYGGETLCLQAWAERLGCNAAALHSRLFRLGWSLERALTTPFLGRLESHRIRQPRTDSSLERQ
jgi:hypothetical protein